MNDKLNIPADFEYELTYLELLDKIKQLQELAERKMLEERPQIIQRLNETITLYRITNTDLKFNTPKTTKVSKRNTKGKGHTVLTTTKFK